MKITDKREEKDKSCFRELTRGAIFIDEDGDVCIKVGSLYEHNEYFAMTLRSGISFSIEPTALVTPVDAELIIYGTK